MILYVAYGSNLNIKQMSYRCPGATVAFTGFLLNWKLVYKGSWTGSYATIKKCKGAKVPVAVWNISMHNEEVLDLYEGYPRFYKKQNVYVHQNTGTRKKLWFISFRILLRLAFHPISTFKLYCKDMMIWDLMQDIYMIL